MTNKPDPKDTKSPAEPHPGMMGDAAFAKDPAKKK